MFRIRYHGEDTIRAWPLRHEKCSERIWTDLPSVELIINLRLLFRLSTLRVQGKFYDNLFIAVILLLLSLLLLLLSSFRAVFARRK